MSIYAEQGATRELIPAGNYMARCYQMIELGTITDTINGRMTTSKKIRIGWELPTELKIFDPAKGEQPLVISSEYTLSTHKKSKLRAVLASWRGKDFSEDEAKKFDVTKVLGAACMLNIIHKNGVADPTKVYEQISSITPLPRGVKAPEAINKKFELSFGSWDKEKFDSLPDFIRNRIMSSAEFQKILRPDETTIPDAADVTEPFADSDLPF